MAEEPSISASPVMGGIIDLRRLERESYRLLGAGFLFAAYVLLLPAVFWHPNPLRIYRTADQPYRHIRVDIIEIPSSGDVPGEGEPAFSIPAIPESRLPAFKRPRIDMGRLFSRLNMLHDGYRAEEEKEARALAEQLTRELVLRGRPEDPSFPPLSSGKGENAPQHGNIMNLAEEGLNLSDIDDLGIYGGFVIQDLNDRRKVKGFAYIPETVRGFPISFSALKKAIPGLIEAMNPFIDIELKLAPAISLDSPVIFRYPVVYISAAGDQVFELGDLQTRRFGEYLRRGGFAILDNGQPWGGFTTIDASFIRLILKALGNDARLDPIPMDHDLFHCCFDIAHPLPTGIAKRAKPVRKNLYETFKRLQAGNAYADLAVNPTELPPNLWGNLNRDPAVQEMRARMEAAPDCLWGVWIGDRLAAVIIDKGYGHNWQEGLSGRQDNSTRASMELGVNLIVYALTQKGGISARYVGR